MVDLLYVEKVTNDVGEVVEDSHRLPHPLPAGTAPHCAADGKTRLWNPDWADGITMTAVNRGYRKDIIELLRSREASVSTPTRINR